MGIEGAPPSTRQAHAGVSNKQKLKTPKQRSSTKSAQAQPSCAHFVPSDVDALIDELLDTLQRALSDAARAELIDALRDVARERRDQVHRV